MKRDDFYPLMKVSLNGECGIVTDQSFEVKNNAQQNANTKVYGVIRWDTNNKEDFEDWRGLWASFLQQGGNEIDQNYKFNFINDDGTFKENQL